MGYYRGNGVSTELYGMKIRYYGHFSVVGVLAFKFKGCDVNLEKALRLYSRQPAEEG